MKTTYNRKEDDFEARWLEGASHRKKTTEPGNPQQKDCPFDETAPYDCFEERGMTYERQGKIQSLFQRPSKAPVGPGRLLAFGLPSCSCGDRNTPPRTAHRKLHYVFDTGSSGVMARARF